jgi:ubiquinone/menaquinone biosynthesis C-methylase UbiE
VAEPRVEYDEIAQVYDQRYVGNDYHGIEKTLSGLVRGRDRVLEVGCGTGRWLDVMRGWGCTVVGLDPSAQMLYVARERIDGGYLARGCAEALPFEAGSCDAVVVVNALHHFDDPARFAKEAMRVLRPGGVVATIGLDPGQGADSWYIYDYFNDVRESDCERYPSCDLIRGLLKAAGFEQATTSLAQRMKRTVDARSYLERGEGAKHTTSQLVLLSDEAYSEGLEQIWRDIRGAEEQGQSLTLRGDLHLYVTSGRVGP